MIGVVISCIFFGFMIGFISGGHYGVDSCYKDIEDNIADKMILEAIVRAYFDEELDDEKKKGFIDSQLRAVRDCKYGN